MHTTLDDDDEEVCFRVTTTSYPFERCLERWRGSFEDDEFAQKSDDCRFEDSANGDDRVNIGESSGYDIVDKNDNSSCRVSLTKVRFVIESPSPPASECDFNVETSVSCDNSRNCEFILDDEQISEQSIASSAILTEIQDEFTDEKNCDDHLRNNLFISNIVQREEFLEKASCDEKEESINGDEKIRNESLRSDLKTYDSNDNVNLNDFDDESNSFAENSASIEQIRQLSNEKNKEMNDVSDTKNNREHASTSRGTFANVPVKVRRNSFLETMLIDDSIDTSINCAIIPTHTVSTPSINNKRSNKVQELDVDITRENGSYELNNAIKVDAENQKVLKDPEEIKEKLTEKTSSAIKPTQSTNRSVGDVKNDVLNELLCNFSSLKLKIVKPENKRPTRKMGANEDIARSVAIDKRIYGEKVNASFELQMHMSSHDEAYDVSMSAEAISSDANNEIAIVEKIVKGEAFARTKIEDKSQNLKNDARDPAIGGRIVKDKNVETMRPDESFRDIKRDARDVVIAGKIVEDIFTKTRADEKPLDIKSMETRANTRIMETFESTKSADEIERGFRKSPNARICKTTLERESADRERQTNEHRKRIPVGAPATMNKIFDSRESETIADASRRDNLENGRKREDVAKKTHGRGDKKTDEEEVIAYDEADTDDRRTASRSTLALENSGDKCAIASETTSVTPCNNDNNRAVTPVAVSKDQSSRDIVTITPGKVRSFIKYYEIRGDVTTEGHSKINDREQVARRKSTRSRATAPSVAARNSQWLEVTTEREARTSEEKCSRLNVLDVLEMSPDKSRLTTFGSRMLEDPIASSADRKTTEAKSEHRERSVATRLHGDETCAQSVKAGAKKSVQFLGGFTVIHSESFDESAGNWGSKKKQAPRRPPSRDSDGCQDFVRGIARSEKLLDVGRGSSQRREVVAEVGEAKIRYYTSTNKIRLTIIANVQFIISIDKYSFAFVL